jgi:hypothetical protein
VPLGGNRGGTLFTLRNLMVTMLLGGLWHGAAWTFVAWGVLHGLMLALERMSKPVVDAAARRLGGLGTLFGGLHDPVRRAGRLGLVPRTGLRARRARSTQAMFVADRQLEAALSAEAKIALIVFGLLWSDALAAAPSRPASLAAPARCAFASP